jgi:type III restriction enzyme
MSARDTRHYRKSWRGRGVGDIRPFLWQVEAVDTAIWLREVAPKSAAGKRLLDQLAWANKKPDPQLMRLALKLAINRLGDNMMKVLRV